MKKFKRRSGCRVAQMRRNTKSRGKIRTAAAYYMLCTCTDKRESVHHVVGGCEFVDASSSSSSSSASFSLSMSSRAFADSPPSSGFDFSSESWAPSSTTGVGGMLKLTRVSSVVPQWTPLSSSETLAWSCSTSSSMSFYWDQQWRKTLLDNGPPNITIPQQHT